MAWCIRRVLAIAVIVIQPWFPALSAMAQSPPQPFQPERTTTG